jgi:hypothetical protein
MRIVIGCGLMLAGLVFACGCLFASNRFPSLPLGPFVAAAFLAGVPPVLIGARLAHRGERPQLTAAEFEGEYNRATFRFAVALGFSVAWAVPLVAPVAVMGSGLAPWDAGFLTIWGGAWCVVVRLGCPGLIRPLHAAVERVALAWYSKRHAEPGAAPDPARGTASASS